MVENDSKKRYMLLNGPDDTSPTAGEIWWIRANQGHSMKVPLDICIACTGWHHADTNAGGKAKSEAHSLGHRYSHGGARDEQDRMGINMYVLVTWTKNVADRCDAVVQGLSRRTRNHIHLAQGVPEDGVISGQFSFYGRFSYRVNSPPGMRESAQVLIYIDLQKALEAGILFFLSENGVVLTEGDVRGFLSPEYFLRVEDRKGRPIPGWPTQSQSGVNMTS
jgi:2'-phosphotransferase